MTPLQFEAAYTPLWDELQAMLDRVEGARPRQKKDKPAAAAEPKA